MERQNRNILIVLIGLVIALAVISSFGLPLFAGPTPTITLPTPVPAVTLGPSGTQPEEGTRVEVKPETVQSVIAVMDRLESYARTVTTTLEGVSVTTRVWVDGAWTRTDMDLPDRVTAHTIVGEEQVWRWYNNDRSVVSWPADGSSMDVEGQRIPTYEDVLELDTASITAAGYQEKNGEACVYVEVSVPELSQVERYWVSASSGLLAAAETETGGTVVYSMTASAPESPVPATASFALPDGTILHEVESVVR